MLQQPSPHPAASTTRRLLIAAIVVCCLGAALRIRQYQARGSYYSDEAFIVLNVRTLSARQLMGKLPWDQAAPPVFLWATQGMRAAFGEGEYALRLLPLLCGLLALAAFARLAWTLLPAHAAVFAIGLFAFCRRFIEYGAQVKQYSGDVMVSTLLLLAAAWRRDDPPLARLGRTALLASVAVWFSHPVVFVFGGISLVLTVQCLRQSRRELLAALAWNALFAASFLTLYQLSIRPQHTDYLVRWWSAGFPDWSRPAATPLWFWRQGMEFLQTPYLWAAPVFLALVIASLCWAKCAKRRDLCAMLAMPIGLAVLSALVRQYPFNGSRLTLFLLPPLFILVAAGSAQVRALLPAAWQPVWWVIPIAIAGHGLIRGVNRFAHPHFESNIRPAVRFAQARRKPGEALVLLGEPTRQSLRNALTARHVEPLCYWPAPDAPLYVGLNSFDDIREQRFWVLAAFNPDDPHALEPLLRALRATASEKDRFLGDGGGAFLFERPAKN